MTSNSGVGAAATVPARGHPGSRPRLPERFCNLERLLWTLDHRGVTDGIVLSLRPNVFYLSGYSSKPSAAVHETNGYGAVVLSPRDPDHPILIVPEHDVAFFVRNPTWIEDIRAYASAINPRQILMDASAFDRIVPPQVSSTSWGPRARASYAENLQLACRRAMKDLGMTYGRIGFDSLHFAHSLVDAEIEVVDAYNLMRSVRQVKTREEIELLRAAAVINESAIQQLVKAWSPGMTWFDLNHVYHVNVAKLGGFVNDPGGVIVANPPGIEPVFYVDTGMDDFELKPGMNIMLDCHGTLNHYCWDSGKTWIIESERTGAAALVERAAIESMQRVRDALKPGIPLGQLQEVGLGVFRQLGAPEPDRASVFFHGLGLEHSDVEVLSAAGRPDWRIEENQLVATHIVYAGDASIRYYLEDNAIAHAAGAETLYTWSYETLVND